MGRYTTVQAYSDTNQNTRKVSYEQAAGSAATKTGGVKAEKVDNPYGSTAGAGSGDFHVYRHARAREMARMKQLDEEEAEQKADAEFETKVSGWKAEEERRTEKRRKKRQREKESKLRKKNMKLGGIGFENVENETSFKKAAINEDGSEEFEYSSMHGISKDEGEEKKVGLKTPNVNCDDMLPPASAASTNVFANDGSFLEMMKKKLTKKDPQKASDKEQVALTKKDEGRSNDAVREG